MTPASPLRRRARPVQGSVVADLRSNRHRDTAAVERRGAVRDAGGHRAIGRRRRGVDQRRHATDRVGEGRVGPVCDDERALRIAQRIEAQIGRPLRVDRVQHIGRRAIGFRVQPVVAQVIRLPRHRRAVVDLVGRRDVVPPAHRPVRIGQGQTRIFRSEARHRQDRQAIAGQMAQADPQIARCGTVVVRPAGNHLVPRIDAGDDVQLGADMHRRDRPHRLERQQVIGDVGQGVERARRGIEPFISHQPRRQPQLEIDAARRQHRRVDHDIGLRQDELIAAGERPIEQADGRRIARVGPEQPLQIEAHVHPRATRDRARDRSQHLVEQGAVIAGCSRDDRVSAGASGATGSASGTRASGCDVCGAPTPSAACASAGVGAINAVLAHRLRKWIVFIARFTRQGQPDGAPARGSPRVAKDGAVDAQPAAVPAAVVVGSDDGKRRPGRASAAPGSGSAGETQRNRRARGPCRRIAAMGQPEVRDQLAQFIGLPGQAARGGGRFLHHRGILLRRGVHLAHRDVDLRQAHRLLLGRRDRAPCASRRPHPRRCRPAPCSW
ncbi:hypothetical protein WR25_20700 [Diploscapter pachys]|uniref:Uncharacterized protein n=1 Tax=Diploscapter pachys TaxID=2018661 RepID=A0A2A2KBD0_9BILA|nr:hypothetical protein WR25_20700 [Diploscapter pachys]